MAEIIEIDFDAVSQPALEIAQFAFSLKPVSTNNLKKPWIATMADGRKVPVMHSTSEADTFKSAMYNILFRQTRRETSRAFGWEKLNRHYSMWLILRDGEKRMEALDADNCHKGVQDAFVNAGIVPDDKFCRDSRQMYGDFKAAGLPDDFLFAVLIRWGHAIPEELLPK